MGRTPPLRPLSYFDVLEACAQPGCPFCRLSDRVVERYLDSIMYEFVNDPGTRAQLRGSLGYCNEHAWRLPATGGGASLGIAILYQDLLGQVLDRLSRARYPRKWKLSPRMIREAFDREVPAMATAEAVRRLRPVAPCPACSYRTAMEAAALVSMVDALAVRDARMVAALQGSSGLCLPHLRRALELVREETALRALLEVEKDKLTHLIHELHEYVRTSDYRFTEADRSPVRDSGLRALAMIVGGRGVR